VIRRLWQLRGWAATYIIGAVIFLVLIRHSVRGGSNHARYAFPEVTARFTLDALPGKQMSIDADLNSV